MVSVEPINARSVQRPGEVLLAHGLASDALPHLLASAEQEPSQWRHPLNLAIAYRFLGQFNEAQNNLDKASRLCPSAWPVYHTWANLLDDLGEFDKSLNLRWQAWSLCHESRQEVALGLGVSLLRQGEWRRAWPYWEMGRFMYSWSPPPGVKVWQRETIRDKRLLVLSEGGYGDVFQFSRWLPGLVEQGATVTLCAWHRQIELLRRSRELEGVQFLPIGAEMDSRQYDYSTSILSLPALFGASFETVPATVTFNILPLLETGQSRRIGICWKAEENGSARKVRSIPDSGIEVFRDVGAEWYSLVPGEKLPWMKDGPDNWLETAQLVLSLDAVVSVDTAVAHLAGCLGKPVMLMLPICAEWRWGLGRTGGPWYDQHLLIRATRPEEWNEVTEKAVKLLG